MSAPQPSKSETPPKGLLRLRLTISKFVRRSGHAHRAKQALRGVVGRVCDLGHLLPLPMLRSPVTPGTPIVTLTSFPQRIARVAMALESIQRQSVRPEKVILVLASTQFPDGRLPWSLRLQLSSSNVELLWVEEDTRSYKKLVPVRLRHPEDALITIDDDVIYRRHFIAELVAASERSPRCIIGHRGWELTVVDGKLGPYAAAVPAGPNSPQERVVLTGVGGILYPPGALPVELLADPEAQRICPTADDIWFWAIARVASTRTLCLATGSRVYRDITSLKSKPSLQAANNGLGLNDRQIAAAVRHFQLQPIIGADVAKPSEGR